MTSCTCARGPGEDHHDACNVTMRAYYEHVARDLRDLLDLPYLPRHTAPREGHAD